MKRNASAAPRPDVPWLPSRSHTGPEASASAAAARSSRAYSGEPITSHASACSRSCPASCARPSSMAPGILVDRATVAPMDVLSDPRGVVFDLDGTLVDNMPIHAEAFAIFVERHGLPPLTLEARAGLDGKRNRDIFPILFGRTLEEDEFQAYAGEKEAIYRELSRGRLVPLRGLPRLLGALERRGIGVALATSAPGPNVQHSLEELGLEPLGPRVARS